MKTPNVEDSSLHHIALDRLAFKGTLCPFEKTLSVEPQTPIPRHSMAAEATGTSSCQWCPHPSYWGHCNLDGTSTHEHNNKLRGTARAKRRVHNVIHGMGFVEPVIILIKLESGMRTRREV